jgi:hypothetical protein
LRKIDLFDHESAGGLSFGSGRCQEGEDGEESEERSGEVHREFGLLKVVGVE